VVALTDPPAWDSLPALEAKQRQAERMRRADPEVRRIKIADQTSKMRDMVRAPAAWDGDEAVSDIEGAELVVGACRGADPMLQAVFDAAAAEAMAKIGGKA
jgi:guanosine-3',5'-bis(diphosphate) 3'-pyrophosphohydrolase